MRDEREKRQGDRETVRDRERRADGMGWDGTIQVISGEQNSVNVSFYNVSPLSSWGEELEGEGVGGRHTG